MAKGVELMCESEHFSVAFPGIAGPRIPLSHNFFTSHRKISKINT